ncbi:MAG: hypothetical protein LBH25_08035 [Fibromonadaceae bacterium]|jgi:hypothetical protein|nr:hypothetical protein [Fibromonadaceae bacterium]
MKKNIILFAIAFLLQSGMLHAQTAYESKSGDVAMITTTFNGTALLGKIVFTDDGEEWTMTGQGYSHTTGGITVDPDKMYQMMVRGIYDHTLWTKVEPIKFIHTDFASPNGYKVRIYGEDSPRKNEVDITFPSGKTITYHYSKELTSQASAQSQSLNTSPYTPAPSAQYTPAPSVQGGGNSRTMCTICNGTGLCSSCKGNHTTACNNCNGTGKYFYGYGSNRKLETCAVCNGSGKSYCGICRNNWYNNPGKCQTCRGKGHI